MSEMESSMSRIGWAAVLPELDRDSIVPLYRQIYEHLREAILAGTLPESTRLPPERTMAERLSVNRSTIVHAYRELVGEGLIEQRVGSGSRVVPQLRGGQPERAAGVPWWVTLPPWRVGEFPNVLGELAAKPEPGRISFVQGVAPDEPSPLGELAKSFGRVARDPRFVLSYGDSEGYEPLRAAIAARMNARGAATVAPSSVIVLTGSTQGIAIVAQSLAEPGDEIIVESPSYPGALQVFQINGLRAIPVPVDDDGMRVDHVEAMLRTRRPRFIYTMPSLHNPTNATMNADRRERLATIARRAGVPIVEDDPYGPLGAARTSAGRARARSRRLHLDLLQNDRAELARGLAGGAANDSRAAAAAQTGLRHGDQPLRAGRHRRLSGARLRRARRAVARGAARTGGRSQTRRSQVLAGQP